MRPFYTLTQVDVGKSTIYAFGRTWLVHNFIGQVLPGDVGKRVYQVRGILQVENDEQRDARLKKVSRYTGQEPGSATCPECGMRVMVRADRTGGDIFNEHGLRNARCPMSRRAVPSEEE